MSTDPVATVTAWARGLDGGRRVVLRCAASAPGGATASGHDQVVRWEGCLRRLSAAELAELVAAAPGLVLRLAGCSCAGAGPGDRGDPPAVRVVRPALEELGAADRLEVEDGVGAGRGGDPVRSGAAGVGPDPTVRTLPVGRRALFAWVAPRGPGHGEDGPGTPAAPDRLRPRSADGHGEAGEQVRLARALQEIRRQGGATSTAPPQAPRGVAATDADATARTGPRSRRLTSSGCTGCSTCVRSCPTSALTLLPPEPATGSAPPDPVSPGARHTPSSLVLGADLSACVGCGRCLALCPVQSLSDEGPLSWADLAAEGPTVLETVQVRECRRCRTSFGGEGELCQVCRMRQRDPFGSWLPPGYVTPRVYAPPPRTGSVSGLEQQVGPDDLRHR